MTSQSFGSSSSSSSHSSPSSSGPPTPNSSTPTTPISTPTPPPPAPPAPRRARPDLTPIITRLRYPLAPLHPLPSGPPHPGFPATILAYHLLPESTLDSIAVYYHQTPSPCIWTNEYPTTMGWDEAWLAHVGEVYGVEARVRCKRRKVGRFIGLRGCETPTAEKDEMDAWLRRRANAAVKGAWGMWGRRGRM